MTCSAYIKQSRKRIYYVIAVFEILALCYIIWQAASFFGSIDEMLDMTFVPTTPYIENGFSEFLVGAEDIEGLWGNSDVDSVIFKYRVVNPPSQATLIEAIANLAMASGWRIREQSPTHVRFTRARAVNSVTVTKYDIGEARVAFVETTGEIYVACGYERSTSADYDNARVGRFMAQVMGSAFDHYVQEAQESGDEGSNPAS